MDKVTRILIDPDHPDLAALEPAAALLRRGGLVAFPTETVYGLGANAFDADAVRRIFVAKGRPSFNPLIVHVADSTAAREISTDWPAEADALAAAFWPGPLTLVLPRAGRVPDVVSAGLPTVALRVPAHPVAAALLRLTALPVAAPSANLSNSLSPTLAEHVAAGLGRRVDLLVDAGASPLGIESAVVDLSGEWPVLLRPGSLSLERLREVVPAIRIRGEGPQGNAPRPSPGMLERHYAPRTPLRTVPTAEWENALVPVSSGRVGALLHSAPAAGIAVPVRMPADPRGYAARLYAALHELDGAGCDLILVEEPPPGAEWHGVRDRLRRASHP